MLVFYRNQPCLDISELDVTFGPNGGKKFGINRDRDPDRDWSELRNTILTNAKEVEETPELRQILLEDLAYMYGRNTIKFREKLKEFKFI